MSFVSASCLAAIWLFGLPFFFTGTAPKKALKPSQISRLSQTALQDACKDWQVEYPPHALDLEIRGMLARAIAGGEGVCAKCFAGTGGNQMVEAAQPALPKPSAQSEAPKVEAAQVVKVEASNPFEEYKAASSPAKVEGVTTSSPAPVASSPAGALATVKPDEEAHMETTRRYTVFLLLLVFLLEFLDVCA